MLNAQDLAPRAYVIAPLHANAVTLTRSFYDGSINYNGALPVSDTTGTYSVLDGYVGVWFFATNSDYQNVSAAWQYSRLGKPQ